MKHRCSLVNKCRSKERKRKREAEATGNVTDFVIVCRGVPEMPVVLSDEGGSQEEVIVDCALSAASLNVKNIVAGELLLQIDPMFSISIFTSSPSSCSHKLLLRLTICEECYSI